MQFLERIDERDQKDGTPLLKRMRQIPRETGKFISLMASMAPVGNYLEVGTSAGYSTMWLSLACMEKNTPLTTIEILEEKQKLASETFEEAGISDFVKLKKGDARKILHSFDNVAFCFLDAEKDVYAECYEILIPRMKKGGVLIADNAISHSDILTPMIERAFDDDRVDPVIIPIGKGVLFCRKR